MSMFTVVLLTFANDTLKCIWLKREIKKQEQYEIEYEKRYINENLNRF